MDYEQVYIVADALFTIGGWHLGKSIWKAKGADPGRGKWYGAFLGFLLGFIGIVTLVGISWRWHPASEPRSALAADERPRPRSSLARPTHLTWVVMVALTAAVTLAAIGVIVGNETLRYLRWSDQMTSEGARVPRAMCSEITLDWGACYAPDGRGLTDREWRARWSKQATEQGLLAGVLLLAGVGFGITAAWAWRARSAAVAAAERREDSEAAAQLRVMLGPIEQPTMADDPGAVNAHAHDERQAHIDAG